MSLQSNNNSTNVGRDSVHGFNGDEVLFYSNGNSSKYRYSVALIVWRESCQRERESERSESGVVTGISDA